MTSPPIPPPANHPASCHGCGGSGYIDGPPIPSRASGQDFHYGTVTTCTHPWTQDDPFQDEDGYSALPGPPPWITAGITLDQWLAHQVRRGG